MSAATVENYMELPYDPAWYPDGIQNTILGILKEMK
jgi:hypothetical protein